MGDELDCIASSDKRFNSKAIDEKYRGEENFIDLMRDDFIDLMMPLKGQIIAGVSSNHNNSYVKVADSSPHYTIAKELGFERLGYGGWVCIGWDWHRATNRRENRARSTTFHVTHGKPTSAITPGGSINTLASDAQWFISDFMAHGHTHRLSAGMSRIFFEPDARYSTYRKRKQHLIQTGSFLKSYSTGKEADFSPYSEVKRYPPIDLGWAVVAVEFDGSGDMRYQCSVREY
jgi:hypothetical protein